MEQNVRISLHMSAQIHIYVYKIKIIYNLNKKKKKKIIYKIIISVCEKLKYYFVNPELLFFC